MTSKRLLLWLPSLLILLGVFVPVQANRAAVNIPPGIDIDELGTDLRRALNSWEAATRSPLPTEWTLVTLRPGETNRIARDVFILATNSSGANPDVLVVGPDGVSEATLARGAPVTMEPLEVLLANHQPSLRRTEVLVRGQQADNPLLSENAERGNSPTTINGREGRPGRMIVESSDARAVSFARTYLNERLRGQSREGAALAARREVPPRPHGAIEVGGLVGRATPLEFSYRDPVNMRLPSDFDGQGFHTANVTLNLVRGTSEALRALSTAASYDSDGRTTSSPRVRAGTDGSGATDVRIGQAGDQWRVRLRALEQSGEVRVESTTFMRVPLDGRHGASFRFDGRRDGQSGTLRARRMGTDAVELTVESRSGDWSNIGAVNTRARVRDGGTVQLARSATTVRRETRSGPPILGDIPYGGPFLGSSSRYDYSSEYALFATVTLE